MSSPFDGMKNSSVQVPQQQNINESSTPNPSPPSAASSKVSSGMPVQVRRETLTAAGLDPLTSMQIGAQIDSSNKGSSSSGDNYGKNINFSVLPSRVSEESALVEEFLSKCRTNPVNLLTVPNNVAGLSMYARSLAWQQVVELSDKLIDFSSESKCVLNTSVKIRFQGLFNLKMFDKLLEDSYKVMKSEERRMSIENSGDLDDIIAVKLQIADVAGIIGHVDDCVRQLFALQQFLEAQGNIDVNSSSMSRKSNLTSWKWKVRFTLLNNQIRHKLWRSAVDNLTSMIDDVRSMIKVFSTSGGIVNFSSLMRVEIILNCRLSRLLFNIGAMTACRHYCNTAELLYQNYLAQNTTEKNLFEDDLFTQVKLMKGLLYFGENNFTEAIQLFDDVIQIEQKKQASNTLSALSNLDLNQSVPTKNDSLGLLSINREQEAMLGYPFASIVALEESLLPIAVNNYSICSLYLKKIDVAVTRLEDLIREDPVRHMIDPVVFNLCTLYDLSCAPELSNAKKKVLQQVATTYNIIDPILNFKSFRL